MKRYFLIAWIAFGLALVSGTSMAAGPQAVDVQVIPYSKSTKLSSSIITVTVRNVTNIPVYLPKVQTPIFTPEDHLQGDLFVITNGSGIRAKFIGRYVRVIPDDPDTYFLKLAPGESATHDLDLAPDYDLSAGGEFSVSYYQWYTTELKVDARGQIASSSMRQQSEVARIWVDPVAKIARSKVDFLVPADGTPGAVCPDDKMKIIRAAQIASVPLVLKAYQAITALYYNEEGKDQYG